LKAWATKTTCDGMNRFTGLLFVIDAFSGVMLIILGMLYAQRATGPWRYVPMLMALVYWAAWATWVATFQPAQDPTPVHNTLGFAGILVSAALLIVWRRRYGKITV
jgi:hypothetical protein